MASPTAEMQVEVQAGPVPALAPETPSASVRVRMDREYIAGGDLFNISSLIRTLPQYTDDIEREHGDGIYERMQKDGHVSSNLRVIKTSVLEDGVTFSPARPEADDPDHDLSVTIADCARRMFDEMGTGFSDALYDLSDALAMGNRVAELVYRIDDSYDTGKPIYVLDRIAPKARKATALVVDPYMKVLGVLGLAPGQGISLFTASTLDEVVKLPNFVPREKLAIWINQPKNSDPRGTSILNPVYNPWWIKAQLWPSYLKYLIQFGSPSLIGETAPEAEQLPNEDDLGNPIPDPTTGSDTSQSPEAIMQQQLLAFQAGTVFVHVNGASVKALEVNGDGQAYINAFSFLNSEMTTAILLQALATDEGSHSTRAAAGVHKDVLDTLIRQLKQTVANMIRFDILRHWVRWNWGDQYLHLVPEISLGEAAQEDFATRATAIAALMKADYFDDSQLVGIDDWLQVPPRDPDWREQKAARLALLPKPPPTPFPANPNQPPDQIDDPEAA